MKLEFRLTMRRIFTILSCHISSLSRTDSILSQVISMKVIALNGSPKPNGNTAIALKTVLESVTENFESAQLETELITLGQGRQGARPQQP